MVLKFVENVKEQFKMKMKEEEEKPFWETGVHPILGKRLEPYGWAKHGIKSMRFPTRLSKGIKSSRMKVYNENHE